VFAFAVTVKASTLQGSRAVGCGSSFYRTLHTGRAIFPQCDIGASQLFPCALL